MKNILKCYIIIIMILVSFSSCNDNKTEIIGCWQNPTDQFHQVWKFEKNGDVYEGDKLGSWELKEDNTLVVNINHGSNLTGKILKIDKKSMLIKEFGLYEFSWTKIECE